VALVLAAALTGCAAHTGPTPGAGAFHGRYCLALDVSEFAPDGSDERWWVVGNIVALQRALTDRRSGAMGGCVPAELDGELTRPGQYGPTGAWPRQLIVYRATHLGTACHGDVASCSR
jgi:hypothetical protein